MMPMVVGRRSVRVLIQANSAETVNKILEILSSDMVELECRQLKA